MVIVFQLQLQEKKKQKKNPKQIKALSCQFVSETFRSKYESTKHEPHEESSCMTIDGL